LHLQSASEFIHDRTDFSIQQFNSIHEMALFDLPN
jgi:hypothetical protein